MTAMPMWSPYFQAHQYYLFSVFNILFAVFLDCRYRLRQILYVAIARYLDLS